MNQPCWNFIMDFCSPDLRDDKLALFQPPIQEYCVTGALWSEYSQQKHNVVYCFFFSILIFGRRKFRNTEGHCLLILIRIAAFISLCPYYRSWNVLFPEHLQLKFCHLCKNLENEIEASSIPVAVVTKHIWLWQIIDWKFGQYIVDILFKSHSWKLQAAHLISGAPSDMCILISWTGFMNSLIFSPQHFWYYFNSLYYIPGRMK